MTLEELQELYTDNLHTVFTHENLKKIANHSNNIQGYSFINRALIHIQDAEATDTRTLDNWQISGRILKDDARGISILGTIQDIHYIDSETQEEVIQSELTPIELKKAIELGMILKEVEIAGIRVEFIYDIESTTKLDICNEQNKVVRNFKLSALLKLAQSMGLVVEKDDNNGTSFEIETNTIKIGIDSIENKVRILIDTLIKKLIYSTAETLEFEDSDLEIVVKYSIYSIYTYYGMDISDISIEIDGLQLPNDADKQDTLVALLEVAEQFMQEYIFNSSQGDNSINTHKISNSKAKRAAMLLSILESNYQACITKNS